MSRYFAILLTMFTLLGGAVSAATVTTNPAANNQYAGIMFDIVTGNQAITLTELSTDLGVLASTYDIYYHVGSAAPVRNTPSAWTLHDTLTFGGSFATLNAWDIADLSLEANTTYGLYITERTYLSGLRYRNYSSVGQVIGSDSNLQILAGYGKGPNFSPTFQPRGFVGTITYEITPVPLPGGLPLLLAGLAGLAALGRRRA